MIDRPSTSHDVALGKPKRAVTAMIRLLFLLLFSEEAFAGELEETPISLRGSTISIPRSYGRLVDVVENNQIHYLYFEDAEGMIRIVLVGQRGTGVKANQELEMLSSNVYLLPRNEQFSSHQNPNYK